MNNFETSLLSYIEVYHDAFTSPIKSQIYCKLCKRNLLKIGWSVVKDYDFVNAVSYHFYADTGRTFFNSSKLQVSKDSHYRCKFTKDSAKLLNFRKQIMYDEVKGNLCGNNIKDLKFVKNKVAFHHSELREIEYTIINGIERFVKKIIGII